MAQLKNKSEIQGMRKAGRVAAEILEAVGEQIRPGITTLELDEFADELTTKKGATSAPFLYVIDPDVPPFPKHICTSVNSVVCHGIPSSEVTLKEGDIINVDITAIVDGWHGDTSRTFAVGHISKPAEKLVKVTHQAMMMGIRAIKPDGDISNIGRSIEAYIKRFNYGIVEELTGHGIGQTFHEEPAIHHYYNKNYSYTLKPGMCFTIEPMINLGSKDIRVLDDKWTIVTSDGKLSAQFEHTVMVTDDGFEILTQL